MENSLGKRISLLYAISVTHLHSKLNQALMCIQTAFIFNASHLSNRPGRGGEGRETLECAFQVIMRNGLMRTKGISTSAHQIFPQQHLDNMTYTNGGRKDSILYTELPGDSLELVLFSCCAEMMYSIKLCIKRLDCLISAWWLGSSVGTLTIYNNCPCVSRSGESRFWKSMICR